MALLPHISDEDLLNHLREYEASGNPIKVGSSVRIWFGTDHKKQINVRVTPTIFAALRAQAAEEPLGG